MKKQSLLVTSVLVLMVSLVLINSCTVGNNKNDYLHKVLDNLDQIKSATYYSYNRASALYDTLPIMTYKKYVKEYTNPADTFIGSTFANFQQADTTKMDFFYDEIVRCHLDWAAKTFEVDSFQNNPWPFRPVGPPFFNYTRSIIKRD